MLVLGVSAFAGGAAAAIVRDGVTLAAAEESRFSRRPQDPSFPRRAIAFCLREAGVAAKDLDAVAFPEKPLRRFERVLVSQLRAWPQSLKTFPREMYLWLGSRLWTRTQVAADAGVDPSRVRFVRHHEAHAAAAYLPSPAADAAILIVDGEGEWATTSLARGSGGSIEILAEVRFPHSLALVASALTAFLGFDPNAAFDVLPALAPLGTPSRVDALERVVRLEDDGSFAVDPRAFRFPFDSGDGSRLFGERLVEVLGPPRLPGGVLRASPPDTRDADLAASFEKLLGDALLRLAAELHRRVPAQDLCFSGEVARDAQATARLAREGPFRRVFVPPDVGDAGTALGAALIVHAREAGGSAARRWVQDHAFLGEDACDDEAPAAGARPLPDDDALVDEVALRLAGGKTVGLAHGRFEWGEQPLGHRSLLADPRALDAQERVGSRVRRQEPFLPLAAAVTAESAERFFDVPPGAAWPLRFMRVAARTTDAARDAAPAIASSGGATRVQIVSKESNPLFHRILSRFGEKTGVPLLVHAPLALRGEPPAAGAADALALFRRSGLDALVVGRALYERT